MWPNPVNGNHYLLIRQHAIVLIVNRNEQCFLDPIRFGADTESQVQRKGREAFGAELPQDFLIRSDYVSGATLSNFMKAVSTPSARSTNTIPRAVQMCFLK